MLDAIEDWQLSSRESLTDLLFTEGQSRETYNVATSNVYANWENGVGNLLGDKPEGTGWLVSENSGSTQAGNPLAAGWLGRAFWGGDETDGASENQSKSKLKTDKTPDARGARELAAQKTISDEDEVKNLEPYLAAMYGQEAMLLLNAFRETGSEVRFVGHWHWGLWWTGGSDLEGDFWSPGIVIDETLYPPEKAEQLMRQLIAASAHSGMRAKRYYGYMTEEYNEHQQSLKQGFNKSVPIVQGIAKAYYEGIGLVSIGADVVVTANELYEHQNPWALIGVLPLVPASIRNSSGNIIVRASNRISVKVSESISGVLSRLNKAQLDELTAKLAKANTDKEAQTILEQFAKLADNAPKGILNSVDDIYRAYPGSRLRATTEQLSQFKHTLKRHGYEVRFVDKLEGGIRGTTNINEKIVYLTRDANQSTLIDEYVHVWNQTQGRGNHLESALADRHKWLESQVHELGSTSALGFVDNLEFHQLELRNLLNLAAHFPHSSMGLRRT